MSDKELVENIAARLVGWRVPEGIAQSDDRIVKAAEIISLCRQHYRTATLDEVKEAVEQDSMRRYGGILRPTECAIKAIDKLRGNDATNND